MTEPPRYTGRLTRDAFGQISGYLEDAWGWRITFRATKKDADGYILEGSLGDVPPALKLANE